jgi:hypothetical protein
MAGADVRYDLGDGDVARPTERFAPTLDPTTEGCRLECLADLLRDTLPLLDRSGGTDAMVDRPSMPPPHRTH